ncbi:hypothetical protein SM033_00030 [Vibrio phage vB_VpaM_sm033]|nr:hypothetical protein SM033_00030 [Vibrio phage vB_VpaM_sm033]
MEAKALKEKYHGKIAHVSSKGISINAETPMYVPALQNTPFEKYFYVEVVEMEDMPDSVVFRFFDFIRAIAACPRKTGEVRLAVRYDFDAAPEEDHIRLEEGDIFQVIPEDWEYDLNGRPIIFQATELTFILDQKITYEEYAKLPEKYPGLKELTPKIICNPNGYYSTLFDDVRSVSEKNITRLQNG